MTEIMRKESEFHLLFMDISNYSDPHIYEQNQLRSNGCIIP